MFQYLTLPHPDPDPVLETTDIATSAPSNFPSQVQQDTAHSTQPLQFPIQGLGMPLVQPENPNSSQKFDTNAQHQSVNALLHQTQAQHVQVHHQTHDQNPTNALAPSRPFLQSQGQPHRTHLTPSHTNNHSLPIPLPLPLPQAQQQVQPVQQAHSPWQSHQMPLGSALLPSPPHYTPSRHLPVGDLLYNAPNILPSSDGPHLPPVSEPSSSRDRNVHGGKRPRSMRKRQPILPCDIPQRSPRKTRAKRSFVWNFFQESKTNPNVALCQLCKLSIPRGRHLARNTTNLRKHLEHRHPTELAEYAKQAGRGEVLQPPGPPHESPAQSQNAKSQINFAVAAPNSEHLHSSLHHASQLPNGHHSSLGNDRQTFAASLSAATACNGLAQDGSNELSLRKSLEESSAMMQCGTERASTGSHLNFSDHMVVSVPYRLSSGLTDRNQAMDHADVDPRNKGQGPMRSNLNPSRSTICPNSGEERQNRIVPGSPVSVGPLEMSSGLFDFLAIMDLPLASLKSRGFEALFSAARLQEHLQSITRLHTGMLLAQKNALREKVRNVLDEAEKIAVVVETTKTCRIILCRYFKRSLIVGHLCLEVIPYDDPFPEDGNETKASVSDMYPSVPINPEHRVLSGAERMQRLLGNIERALEDWDIREKVIAVVTSERSSSAEKYQFLPRKALRKPSQSPSAREESDSSRSSRQVPIYNEMHKERATHCNGTTEVTSPSHSKIPMVSCLVRVVETIVSDTICEDEDVKRLFIEPMSKGMFKALADRNFLVSEDIQTRPMNLKLPLTNLSMQDMLALLEYFIPHLDRIQAVLKRQGDTSDMDVLCMHKGDLKFLQMLVLAFSNSLGLIRGVKQGVVFRSERISLALPAMKQISQKVEKIYHRVGEPLKKVALNVLQAVKFQYQAMESQEVYTCATLLDPRFKSEYFTSKDVADMAEASVADTYECERRRNEEKRHPRERAGNLQDILAAPPSALDHFMDSIIAERTLLSTSLSAYLEEPILKYGEDVEAYWREHQQKWPALCEIAAQYGLIPCTSETDRVHSVLGDYRKVNSMGGNESSDALALTFLKNNLLLMEGNSIFQ